MQLFAKDDIKALISADRALNRRDYHCLECGSAVRVRGGRHKRKHFYHLSAVRSCRQNGKSLTHLHIQCAIANMLPAGEAAIEKRFDDGGRIADVCWEAQRLIFEVQCSPITPEEIAARHRDYGALGYTVVWILHDKRFNRRRVAAAEAFLQNHPHYYTNMDAQGLGIIYDQYSRQNHHRRHNRVGPFPVNLSAPIFFPSIFPKQSPFIQQRLSSWPLGFQGDLLDLFLKNNPWEHEKKAMETILRLDAGLSKTRLWRGLIRWPASLYRLLFRYILEKSCR